MKSKMKSAFAIIAVALMIMVAVVPMVGVFTEDSSAAVTVVPEVPSDKKITISGKVANAANGSIADVLVKVEGDGVSEYVLTTASGYSATIYSLGKDLTVSVVVDGAEYAKITGKTTANPVLGYTFSEQKLTKVSASVRDVDFKAGYVAVSGNLEYKNATDKYMADVSVSYMVGEETGATSVTSVKGTYSILVPAGSKDVTILADGFTSVKIDDVGTAAQTSKTLKHATLNFRTITINDGDIAKDVISGNVLSITPVDGSRVTINSVGSIEDKKVGVEYTLADATETLNNVKVKVSDTLGFGKETTGDITSIASYTYNAYVTGEIKAGSVPVYTNNVSIKFYKDDGTTEVADASTTATVVDNKYYAPLGKITSADAKKIIASFETNELVKGSSAATSISTSGKTTANITVANDLVNKFSLITVTIAGTSGITIEVSGEAKTIGEKDGNIVTTGVTQTFYAETGKNILIRPTSGVFDVESREFVVSGATTVVFNINTKEYTNADYPVKDAAGKALKDVEVFYKIGETGAYNTTAIKTDKDGKFKITVNSNVSADDVLVYFKDAKYTFNSNVSKPFALSSTEEKDWKAKEQTLTFEVKDAAGKDITNVSGLALQFAKYKIHAVGAGVNAFDMIGTASDVTYDATTKKFSFVAESIPASTEDYRVAYGISVKTVIAGYTFATITEYAENLVIKANEYTLTGFVKDAAGDKAVNGANVTSTIASTTSNVKGYFGILVKTEDEITVTGESSGYTFSTDAIKTAGEKEITIKANEKTFTGTIKDADGKAVTGAGYTITVENDSGAVVGIATVTTAANKGEFTIVTAVAEGYILKATDSASKRTFAPITLKGTETTLDVVSKQATYSGKVYLADGTTAISGVSVQAFKTSATEPDATVGSAVTTDASGSYEMLLDTTYDKAYVVKATLTDYVFSTTGVAFKDYVADIKSTTKITDAGVTTSTIALKDAAGEKLGAGYVVKAYYMTGSGATAKYDLIGTFTTDKSGEFKCLYTGTGYVFNVTSPSGSVYTFEEYDNATSSVINAKESTKAGTLKSQNNVAIPDATISFLDKDGKVLTTAKTDADGKWSATLIVGDVKKITANTSKYGAITLDQTTITDTFKISEYIYSGLYANGEAISGVVVVFEMKNGSTFIQMGKAAIVDDKYYVVADNAFATGYTMTVSATASNFNAYGTYTASAVAMNLDVGKKPGVVSIATDDVFFGEFYTIYNATNAQVGDKIILRASEVAYKPLEDGNETTVVKYKFNGWYVNGVKVSDDLEYVYTVTEDCLVYADYKESTYETASDDNGISPSVLVIGIAAVIVALFAVVYTVIQKKE